MCVHVELNGRVAVLTIQREQRLNAIDDEVLGAFWRVLQRAREKEFSALVVRGQGVKAFSSGSDVKELASASVDGRLAHTVLSQRILDEIEESPCPVIAAIEGYCLGGGLELALACDLRVAGTGVTFGLPEVSIHALPTGGGTFRLARVVGVGRAKEVVLFGRRLTAQEAWEWGLVSEVVATGAALERSLEIARSLVESTDATTIALAKSLVHYNYGLPSRTAGYLEYLADISQSSSDEQHAEFSAFSQRKRHRGQ